MEMEQLTALFPHIATQLRYALSNLHMAAAALAPTQARELDPVLDQRAAVLDQSFYQMLRLVNQLSAAVYLADEKPLPLRNRDISELVEELCAAASSLAPLKGLALTVKNELGHHVCAVAPDELEQLVYNLLSNAFKFTPAGGTVEVELRRREGCILLTVRDSGCGIPPEQMEMLFTPHADPLLPPPHGVGLGLVLCRRFALGQGGRLLARSEVGQGSEFTLSLPDRLVDEPLSDIHVDYTGGFSCTLLGLADALPSGAFRVSEQE